MVGVKLQIGEGEIFDTYEKWGLIYLDADKYTESPIKPRDTTSYPEDAGEHVDKRTVQAAFDYSVRFAIDTPNSLPTSANAIIDAFNRALYETVGGSNVRRYQEVTFYNDFDQVMIVGLPEPIAQPEEWYRSRNKRTNDIAVVEFKIRVNDPSKCNFNLNVNTN